MRPERLLPDLGAMDVAEKAVGVGLGCATFGAIVFAAGFPPRFCAALVALGAAFVAFGLVYGALEDARKERGR